MKKLLLLVLAIAMVLSLTACGGDKPAASPAASAAPAPTPAPSSAAPASEAAPSSEAQASAQVGEPAAAPRSYTHKYSQNDSKTNNNIVRNASAVWFDKSVGTTVEYTAIARELEAFYKEKDIVWPELDEEWKSYNYIDITNTDEVSSRTMDVGQYQSKGDKVIKEHIDWLVGIAGQPKKLDPKGKDVVIGVPWNCLEYDKSLTKKQLAGIAYEMYYLQTWFLIPAESHSVLIKTPDGTYNGEMILELPEY